VATVSWASAIRARGCATWSARLSAASLAAPAAVARESPVEWSSATPPWRAPLPFAHHVQSSGLHRHHQPAHPLVHYTYERLVSLANAGLIHHAPSLTFCTTYYVTSPDGRRTGPTPDGRDGKILVRDTWTTAIVSDLTPMDGDIVVSKHRYSGFYQTDLDAILKTFEVKYLIVTRCTTSVCVESTIRDAMFRDYSCVLLADCTAEPGGHDLPRSNHDASLLVIRTLFGWCSPRRSCAKRCVHSTTGGGWREADIGGHCFMNWRAAPRVGCGADLRVAQPEPEVQSRL
jgi:nicotinamidase-related amidase